MTLLRRATETLTPQPREGITKLPIPELSSRHDLDTHTQHTISTTISSSYFSSSKSHPVTS